MLPYILTGVALVVWMIGMFPAAEAYERWYLAPLWPLHVLLRLIFECPLWLLFWD